MYWDVATSIVNVIASVACCDIGRVVTVKTKSIVILLLWLNRAAGQQNIYQVSSGTQF